jgi:peroxiredoxin
MANILTGDFDVVAEFAYYTVNRILAAMHQTGRFLHSISVRVDDNPHPTRPRWPVVIGIVDAFGDAVANQRQIGCPNPFPGSSAVTDPVASRLGILLNPDRLVFAPPEIVPSHISGTAQIQLFPPTVTIPQGAVSNVIVNMNLIVRFFPDKGTAPLAEFMRGNLQITAPLTRIVTGGVRVVDIDFKADEATINFTPTYTSTPLSVEDLVGINLCIQNGLQTGFLPSTINLPSSIADVQVKTLPDVFAIMLDFNDQASSASSVTNVFLSGEDDFAFAVGCGYLLSVLRQISDNILKQSFQNVEFTFLDLHYSYPIKINSANFELQTGKIVLTLNGTAGPEIHGHTPSGPFSFTVTVEFSLQPSLSSAKLMIGNVSVSTGSTLAGIYDYFTGNITNSVRNAVIDAISSTGADATVSDTFDANNIFANSLNAQMYPPNSGQGQIGIVWPFCQSIDIQPAGIVFHGYIILFEWPAPYVEFEPIPVNTANNPVVSPIYQGTDYSALKTWIPGGTITQYEWSMQGQQAFDVDKNRFVLLSSGPGLEAAARATASAASAPVTAVPGYAPLCLTITGTRISAYGSPVSYQNVTASVCGYTRFHLPVGLAGTKEAGMLPIAITRPEPSGGMIVSGYTAADIDQTGGNSPNLIVHFVDSKSFAQLKILTDAIARSNRADAPVGAIAVLTPDQLSKAPFAPGIVYAVDQDGSWAGAFGVKSAARPLSLIVDPRGRIAWQKDGAADISELSVALIRHLVKRAPVRLSLPRLNARIGQVAPNFIFEYSPGREMPLSKVSGAAILVFCKASVKGSIQAVRNVTQALSSGNGKASALAVFAIFDGDDSSVARAVAAESGLTAIVVSDPKREISLGYGVTMWPTIVSINESGTIVGIKYGYVPGDPVVWPSRPPMPTNRRGAAPTKPVASSSPSKPAGVPNIKR